MGFLDANDLVWGAPEVEIDADMVERLAAGEAALEVVGWIRRRVSEKGR